MARAMRLLVIGGTRFLGRAIVDAAPGRGHQVTLFNRGKTNPDLYPGLQTIHGDRRRNAALLRGLDFDVAIWLDRAELFHLREDIDDTPRLCDPAVHEAEDEDLVVGDPLSRWFQAHVLALVRARDRVPADDLVSKSRPHHGCSSRPETA